MLFQRLLILRDPEVHEAALNMAIDEVLLRRVEKSGPLLRVYRWARPAVSMGYFDRIAEAEALAGGRDIVRRWTGGGLVEHGADLTYTLIVPRNHALCAQSAAESYRLIHEAIAPLLQTTAGHRVTVASRAMAKVSAACFENPVQYDLVAGEEKLAGAAQRRTRWGLLHQGSIQGLISIEEQAERLAELLAETFQEEDLTNEIIREAEQLVQERYGTVEWRQKW